MSTELSTPSETTPSRPPSAILHAPSSSYVPLRVRSHYSFLDSTLSPAAIVELAGRHGCSAVALTDFGNLHGAVEFTLAARKAGIKPILGAEIRVGDAPLLLYVESARGYANLCRLLSAANRPRPSSSSSSSKRSGRIEDEDDGRGREENAGSVADFYRRNFAREDLAGLTEGLLAVSSDARLAELFPGRFYQAATARDPESRHSLVACPAVHYATPADRLKFDIVQSIRTRTLLRQAHPAKRLEGRFHFRTPAEMQAACKAHPDWLAHSREIAERCVFELSFGKPQFPAFATPDGSAPREFLRTLVFQGLRARYGERGAVTQHGARVAPAQLRAQAETELGIIAAVGYEEYFLVVWGILQECRQRGLGWITRGSAADSLVCYGLRISDVCPLRFDLYFRRFLNQERMQLNKLPDIDVDFAHDHKDDVVDLIFARYGREHCAVVGGFSTFKARAAVAEVAKVLGVSEYQVRRFTEHFPWSFGGSHSSSSSSLVLDNAARIEHEDEDEGRGRNQNSADNGLVAMLRAIPECRDLPLDEEPYRTALEVAGFLDGVPRYPKMHPCGVVLSRQPMHELTPTFVSNKGYPTTHFDMDAVEAIGLVKMDILAQGGLAVMRDVKASLAAGGVAVDLARFTVNGQALRNPKSEKLSGGLDKRHAAPVSGACSAGFQTCCIADFQIGGGCEVEQPAGLETHDTADWAVCATRPGPPDDAESSFRISDFGFPSDFEFRVSGCSPVPANVSEAAFDDPRVWEMIARGGARAVHHIESPAMTSLCRMTNVYEIDGLIAIVSVIRPGAANEQKKLKFTRRYQGLEPIEYPHPSLEACLRSTFGLVVYEEHILQLCEAFAGLPPGRADVLRRALNKYQHETIEEIRREFFAAARARGHAPDKIAEVWGLASGFAGYAFCKAHSTAYGVEAYQSAWLKRYFPAEFMAAVLTNGKGFYDPLVYVLECHRLGISLRPPSVNEPGPGFAVAQRPKLEIRNPKSEVRNPKSEALSGGSGEALPATPGRSGEPHALLREPFQKPVAADVSPLHSRPQQQSGLTSAATGPKGDLRTSDFGLRTFIRVPLTRVKGLTEHTGERILAERSRALFASLADFYRRVAPRPEELEAMIRVGAFDEFGATRTAQFWEAQWLARAYGHKLEPGQGWLFAKSEVRSPKSEGHGSTSAPEASGQRSAGFQTCCIADFQVGGVCDVMRSAGLKTRDTAGLETCATTAAAEHADFHPADALHDEAPHSAFRIPHLKEPTRRERLQWENELLGFPASGHPLELHDDVAWETYCPVARLGEYVGEQVVTCGLVVEQRVHHQVTGEPMKFLTLADWTGMVETELFAPTYRSYGLATVRYPVLEITATVEPFENGRGFSLRVLRAGKPRMKPLDDRNRGEACEEA